MPRPLSSAISIQALERIVNSEESLTSNIEPSKSPSDIGAPSKASSDFDYLKINSDIGINAQSIRDELVFKVKSEIATYESNCDVQQNCITEANIKTRLESDLVNSEPIKAEIIAVETTPKIKQARVAAKRGKLAHTASNLNALVCHSKIFKDPQIGEGTNVDEKTSRIILYSRKLKFSMLERIQLYTIVQNNSIQLYAIVQKYSQHDFSANVDFVNDVSVDISTKNHVRDITGQLFRIYQDYQRLKKIKSNSCKYRRATTSFGNRELFANKSSNWANYALHNTI